MWDTPHSALPRRVTGSSTDGGGRLGRRRVAAFEQNNWRHCLTTRLVEIGVLPRCFPGAAADKIRAAAG